MQEEVWKDVVGYEGIYQISNTGRVKSLARTVEYWNPRWGCMVSRVIEEKLLTPCNNQFGYPVVHLRNSSKGKSHKLLVHRMMAIAFIPNPDSKPAINHMNGCKTDYNLGNLEWVTNKENTQHAIAMGLVVPPKNLSPMRGEGHWGSKLTVVQVKGIREMRNSGYTYKDIATVYGIHWVTVGKICRKVLWKHV